MENDLISRSALLEAFDNLQPPGFEKSISGMVALRMIKGAPAVNAVEVVRCKDCKRRYDSKFGYVVCVWFNKTVRADGYCAYGEAKNE